MADIPISDSLSPNIERDGDFKMPSMEELLDALEKMDLSAENKQELRDSILSRSDDKLNSFLPPVETAVSNAYASDFVILVLMISIITLVFVFFGYKLYQSLVQRERRKEEKRRQKQQKKKKL